MISKMMNCRWLILLACCAGMAGAAVPSAPAARVAAAPVFSVPGGVHVGNLTVGLSGKASVIRYTLDGSEPTSASPAYREPLRLTETTLLKAKSFDAGSTPSPTVLQSYTLVDPALAGFSSSLPIVILNTFQEPVNTEQKTPVSAVIIPVVNGRATLATAMDYNGRGTIETRGRSSLDYPKKSFNFHTKDDRGAPLKVPLLGLPKESEWVLYAPYPDKTLMRDVLAYELSAAMGHYAPRTRFVEVFVNRTGGKLNRAKYFGVYVLEEKIKRGKDRVDIAKLGPGDNREPEISGGYIFKRDHRDKDNPGFSTQGGRSFYYVEPKGGEITPAQSAWLIGYLDRFEAALTGESFKDPVKGYATYIDTASFIDHHWIVEFSKNVDGIRFSNFIHKDRGGKLKMEPIWDWNLSFGNARGRDGYSPQGWYADELTAAEHLWFHRLFQDPNFAQKYADRWSQLRTNEFEVTRVLARIDQIAAQLDEAQAHNFQRWPILGKRINPNFHVESTYQGEVNWMKAWIRERIAWIDRQFPVAPAVRPMPDGKKFRLEIPVPPKKILPPPAPGQDFTLFLEAESGTIVSPMAILNDPAANGKRFIATSAAIKGTATYKFTVPATNQYYLWARVIAPSSSYNTFFFSMDDEPDEVYDAAEKHFSPAWQWNRWSGRLQGHSAQNDEPRIFQLAPGVHTLHLRGREVNSKLDRLCITSNPNFQPEPPADEVTADVRIYYTLDGTDPRLPGGDVSPKARLYETPLALPKNAQIFARALKGDRWSAPAAARF